METGPGEAFPFVPHSDLDFPGREGRDDPEIDSMIRLVEDLHMLRRTAVSDDLDRALAYVGRLLPLTVHEFPSGEEVGTWTVPKRWTVREAWIRRGDRTICDVRDHPLHLCSHSVPFAGTLARADLLSHLRWDTDRPGAIPYDAGFVHRTGWGFCLPYDVVRSLPEGEYGVRIDASLENGTLKVGECVLPGRSPVSAVFCSHIDHPGQANDGLSSVAIGVALFRRLAALPERRLSFRLVLCPENIGSLCWLVKMRNEVPRMRYGVVLEMLGNKNHLALQRSRRGDADVDLVAEEVLRRTGRRHRVGAFRGVVGNDEVNLDGPGFEIPTVSLSRWIYPEYHTSDDRPGIIGPRAMREALEVATGIAFALDRNVRPRRRYVGVPFLSRYGLWEDLNRDDAVERVALSFEGDRSVARIARDLGLPFDRVAAYAERFRDAGLVDLLDETEGQGKSDPR